MSQYHTRQKTAIAKFFADNRDRGFSPEEVYENLPEIPRSTVYRIITQLSCSGFLRKTGSDGRRAVYQYQGKDCSSHMHIRCIECGAIEHLDADVSRKIEEMVNHSSGYTALESTVFEGLCRKCREDRR